MVKKNATPRYEVSIIDPPIQPKSGICGVCIIPIGREHEWLFSSNEGQMNFATMSGYARFIIVRMNRDHNYQDMETIQNELSPYMQKLKIIATPKKIQNASWLHRLTWAYLYNI